MASAYEIPHTWEEPEGLHDLMQLIRETNPSADLRKIRYAYYVAEEAHAGQVRQSGEPYITHPLAVARIIVELQMDDATVCAALLHDTLEDNESITSEFLREQFGEDVEHLVDGVTKLRFKQAEALTERQQQAAKSAQHAETIRKMLLAMARDVRVMVIKLADRLHNMRTLDAMPADKRIRISSETLDIYAPLAARLGIWQVKWQLEDLAFKYLHPKEFQEITELVAKRRDVRERELQEAIVILKERLESRGIHGSEIQGRPKHLYSIFNKIAKHGFKFEEILDLLAIRVILKDTGECYLALGIVHDLWVPVPGLFSDYIAKPKPNGYQSLHTKIVGPHGEPLEVQIRTRHMHQIAEYGVAAHWAYKEGSDKQHGEGAIEHLRQQLFDWSSDHRTSSDFLRSMTTDLFSEQVFCFTPKGDVLDLPHGSTPVDFAFRIHSNIGITTVGAKINGKIEPLSTRLKNGDVVELITRSNAQPSLDWLEFIQSAHTRNKLRSYFRKRNKAENAARGKDAIERELRLVGIDPKDVLGEEKLENLVKTIPDCDTPTDFLAKVGEGLMSVGSAVTKLRGLLPAPTTTEPRIVTNKAREGQVMIVTGGIDNVMFRRGRCCDPLPGEDVVGFITRGRGVVIHRRMCTNALALQSEQGERLQELNWPRDGRTYATTLKIQTVNRQGLLMDIMTVFGEAKVNVTQAKVNTLPNQTAVIEVTIEVQDTDHLNQVMTKISNFSDVISILRVFGRSGKS